MSVFQDLPSHKILFEDDFFYVVKDKYPVSNGHLLIISKDLKLDYFQLSEQEQKMLPRTINRVKELIESEFAPDGYNIGMNCGEAAGQTVMHFHCHVIPRYLGDMENPRGGVRHCIEGKGYY